MNAVTFVSTGNTRESRCMKLSQSNFRSQLLFFISGLICLLFYRSFDSLAVQLLMLLHLLGAALTSVLEGTAPQCCTVAIVLRLLCILLGEWIKYKIYNSSQLIPPSPPSVHCHSMWVIKLRIRCILSKLTGSSNSCLRSFLV